MQNVTPKMSATPGRSAGPVLHSGNTTPKFYGEKLGLTAEDLAKLEAEECDLTFVGSVRKNNVLRSICGYADNGS
jgi:hypothetical protein